MRPNLFYEVVIVGLLTLAFTFGIFFLFNGHLPETTKPGYKQMILGAFLVGGLLHLSLELLGLNERWCRTTYRI